MFNKLSKLNKTLLLLLIIILFFVIYFFSFKLSRNYIQSKTGEDVVSIDTRGEKSKIEEDIELRNKAESKMQPLQKFNQSKKLFISDDSVENIKIEGEMLENLKRLSTSFVKVRSIEGEFNPQNRGNTNNNVKFETDFNYFVVESDGKKENYKVPISVKEDFQGMYKRMIYTSVDYIKNKDGVGDIRVYKGNEEKGVFPWKKDDLINKILYKREVGKIQPQKEFHRTKTNFTIKIEKNGNKIDIQTMGKDFIQVTNSDNVAYYEVYQDLYNYLDKEVFK